MSNPIGLQVPHEPPKHSPLIYDWNRVDKSFAPRRVMLDDETLRDGLQCPSVHNPRIKQKLQILHLIDALDIDSADIGLPIEVAAFMPVRRTTS